MSTPVRDPRQQPFASSSIWNMPVGSLATYVAANMPANPGTDNFTPMPQIDDERIVLAPNSPATTIAYSSAGWTGANRCSPTGGSVPSLPITVPMPAAYTVAHSNKNECAAFLQANGRTVSQCQPLARCTAGGTGTSIVAFADVDLFGDGITGAHGGSGLSAYGGCIRVGELRPGQTGMRHAVKMNVPSPQVLYNCAVIGDCFRWPAIKADSGAVGDYGSANPSPIFAMRMGALLAIPVSTDITALGLQSDPGRQLAWTLQNYGAYIVDSTGGPAYALSAENGPAGSVRAQFLADWGYPLEGRINDHTPWTNDVQKLVVALYVVDNNTSTSIGGGGTPRQPLAPEISPVDVVLTVGPTTAGTAAGPVSGNGTGTGTARDDGKSAGLLSTDGTNAGATTLSRRT